MQILFKVLTTMILDFGKYKSVSAKHAPIEYMIFQEWRKWKEERETELEETWAVGLFCLDLAMIGIYLIVCGCSVSAA